MHAREIGGSGARSGNPSRLRAQRERDSSIQGDFSVYEQILNIVHRTAAELMAAKGIEPAELGSGVITEDSDNLVDRYGFSSIDTLEYLLILEGKFGITLADEDLSEELLSSATRLAKRIDETHSTAFHG